MISVVGCSYIVCRFKAVRFFAENVNIDGDDPAHIKWMYEKSVQRANQYNIGGVTYRLTQGEICFRSPEVSTG